MTCCETNDFTLTVQTTTDECGTATSKLVHQRQQSTQRRNKAEWVLSGKFQTRLSPLRQMAQKDSMAVVCLNL